jgi:hypothetical protein
MIRVQLTFLDLLEAQMEEIEDRIATVLKPSPAVRLLRSVPGLGEILAPLVWLEIGDVDRFPGAEKLTSYAGLVPRIHASGGRIRRGGTCRNVNQYLKWGFVEAATCAVRLKAYRDGQIGKLYHRLVPAKGMAELLLPSPAIWPRQATGYCANSNPTKRQVHVPSRPDKFVQFGSTRDTSDQTTGHGVNAEADQQRLMPERTANRWLMTKTT